MDNADSTLPVMPKPGREQGIGSLPVLLMLVKGQGVRRQGINLAIEIIQKCAVNNTFHAQDTTKHFMLYTVKYWQERDPIHKWQSRAC